MLRLLLVPVAAAGCSHRESTPLETLSHLICLVGCLLGIDKETIPADSLIYWPGDKAMPCDSGLPL